MTFTLDEATALVTGARRAAADDGSRAALERRLAVSRLVAAAGYGPSHQITAVLHEDVDGARVTPALVEGLGAPAEVVLALDSVTRRQDSGYRTGWEPYLGCLVERAAANDIGRVVKLFDAVVAVLPWHADPDPTVRARVEARYAASRRSLLTAEAARRDAGLEGAFPLEDAALLRYLIALDARTRSSGSYAAVARRLRERAEPASGSDPQAVLNLRLAVG